MRIQVAVAGLHDVVVRKPLDGRVGVLVDRGWVQRDGLVVRDVAPAFTLAGQELGVEAPGDDGVDDDVVGAVEVVFFWDGEELALAVT